MCVHGDQGPASGMCVCEYVCRGVRVSFRCVVCECVCMGVMDKL